MKKVYIHTYIYIYIYITTKKTTIKENDKREFFWTAIATKLIIVD